jgi:addiction module HigA family antidote
MSQDSHAATPAEALAEHLRQADISASALARKMGVPPNRVTRVLNERTAVTAETALLLEKQFEEPAEYWLALQARYALAQARSRAAASGVRDQNSKPELTAPAEA